MTRGAWTSVTVRAPRDRLAIVSALFASGAEGVQELEQDLVTHIRDADESRIARAIADADPAARVQFAPTPDVDWSAEWKSRIGAHRLGKLVVTPPWLAQDFTVQQRIVIDPGMAFGTGEHETTRGVLRLLQRVLRPGDDVADLGAGSAVLAIGAAKLGARRVTAIELDPDAIGNAEENVERNDVASIVSVIEGDAALLLPLVAPVRVILANIISSVLIELLPVMHDALTPDGACILSGILVEERDRMREALADAGWRITETDEEGAWWSVAATPR